MEWLEAFLHRPSCRRVLQQETCVRAGLGQEAGGPSQRQAVPTGCCGLCHRGRGCVSQKEMHEAVRIFLGIYLSLKMETGFRSLLGEAAALTFRVGRVRHESHREETR